MKVLILSAMVVVAALGPITPVSASNDPIPGVDVVVEKIPPGHSIGRTTTTANGIIALKGRHEQGYYEVSDRANTNRAGINHRGGEIRWQLVKSGNRRNPWKLIPAR
jgi:hypothetical protein